MPVRAGALRVALCTYRGHPHTGGQGVYVRQLARGLAALGHHVEVFAGPPYPDIDPGITLNRIPSLDLYRPHDPFRTPGLWEFRDAVDVLEYGLMCTAAFPEPLTFSLRVKRVLQARRADFDIVHDNQCLGYGMLALQLAGMPVVASIHHPIEVDRDLELAAAPSWQRRFILRRWYKFARMQARVARQMPRLITVSESSRQEISRQAGVSLDRITAVPIGVDHEVFRPMPEVARIPGRILAMASADVPLKGLMPLLEAVARVRRHRPAELVVVARPRHGSDMPATLRRLGLTGAVRFVDGIDEGALVRLYAEAEVACVPSLYEGFSLPAVQAMACGLALVATSAGALPEVVGRDGVTGLIVRPGDSEALAEALGRALGDAGLRDRLAAAARTRVGALFNWGATAAATAEVYRDVLAERC